MSSLNDERNAAPAGAAVLGPGGRAFGSLAGAPCRPSRWWVVLGLGLSAWLGVGSVVGPEARAGQLAQYPAKNRVELPDLQPSAAKIRKNHRAIGHSRVTTTLPTKAKLCEFRTPLHHHQVQWGETLSGIAGTYGVRRQEIIQLNPELKNPDQLRLAQTLRICPEIAPRQRVEKRYQVQVADSLHRIARLHALSLRELIAMQGPGFDANAPLRHGQTLRIVAQGTVLPGFSADEEANDPQDIAGAPLAVVHRLPTSRLYRVKRSERTYGTRNMVNALVGVAQAFSQRSGGKQLLLGDLSRKGGGPLSGHRSHRSGNDVDVALFLRQSALGRDFMQATRKTLDARATWWLIEAFLKTKMVRYIFIDYDLQAELYEQARRSGASEAQLDEYFQYPRGKHRRYGIIRHWPKHKDHFHVRFRR